MSVPSYADLGKSARDVFRTGYAYDLAKFKLNAQAGLEGDFAFDLRKSEVSPRIVYAHVCATRRGIELF